MTLFSAYHGNFPSTPRNEGSLPPPPPKFPSSKLSRTGSSSSLYTSFNIMAWHRPLTPLQKTGCLKQEGQFLLLFTLNLILPHSLTQSLQFNPVFSYILSPPMHLKNQCHLLPFSYTSPHTAPPTPTAQHVLPLCNTPFFMCSFSSWTTLKMVAASSSETLVPAYRLQWHHRQVE